jgi:tRNA nucleotidyltransferase/poly(A) polymerase
MLRRPSIQDLSPAMRDVAREIAERIARRGARAWIVGGAVRDLALGRTPEDVDMASSLAPDAIEAEFERTIPIGRNFGTMIVHVRGLDVEHTTFRSEEGYADLRRPDVVRFGASPEEDAARRDFTCNALYLDPRTDEVFDPTQGLADLAAGRLRCVGDSAARFAEDGLRLVRLARFAGALGLEPAPEALAAARTSADALRGVSRERILLELEAMMAKGGVARALDVLESCGLVDRALPGFDRLRPPSVPRAAWFARRRSLFEHAPPRPGVALGLALLFGPDSEVSGPAAALDTSIELLASVKPSRDLERRIADAWSIGKELRCAESPARSVRIRWMRRVGFEVALGCLRAHAAAAGVDARAVAALADEYALLGRAGIAPDPWITAADLRERGIAPGPAYGVILHEAETLQLDRAFQDRAAALLWLDARVQDGGKSLRKPNASG